MKTFFSFVKNRLTSLCCALKGLHVLLKTQTHARLHLLATVIVLVLSGYFRIAAGEWGLVLFAVGFVWAAEAFNTALEKLADAAVPARNPMVGQAKDAAAAAVLVAAVIAGIIGLIIFLPRIFPVLLTN